MVWRTEHHQVTKIGDWGDAYQLTLMIKKQSAKKNTAELTILT